MEAYVAFSIHGTNKFSVATKVLLDVPKGFTVVKSRDLKAKGVKLHWDKLNRKDGTPLTDKGWVTKRFNELARDGWHIVKLHGEG